MVSETPLEMARRLGIAESEAADLLEKEAVKPKPVRRKPRSSSKGKVQE